MFPSLQHGVSVSVFLTDWATVAHKGVDFTGSDIRSELVDSADSCQRKCTEDPQCQFYTYADETFSDPNYW